MQRLDEPSLVADRAPPGGNPLRIGGNETAGTRDLVRIRRESGIGGFDLRRMNQRLAVKAQLAPLPARRGEPFCIVKVELDPVEHRTSVRPCREQYQP